MGCAQPINTSNYSEIAKQGFLDGKRDAKMDFTSGSGLTAFDVKSATESLLLQNRVLSLKDKPDEYVMAYKQGYLEQSRQLRSNESTVYILLLCLALVVLIAVQVNAENPQSYYY